MLTNLFMLSLLAGGDFKSKLLKLADSVVVTPDKQAYIDNCQSTLDTIKATEGSVGDINKDNLRSYWDARLTPDTLSNSIANCATVQSSEALRVEHKETLEAVYTFYKTLNLVVDTHGQPSFFDPSYMQLFDPNIPLVETHQACKPELMRMIEPTINKSWLMTGLSTIEEKATNNTVFPEFVETLKTDKQNFYNIALEKTDVCIMAKLKDVRPYAERAPASVRKAWESTVRKAFTDNTDIPIVKIVFTTPEFKRIVDTKAEFTHSGDLNVNHQDYDAMDVMVYARNGEYVDGFIVTLYKDRVQGTSYARFYGFNAYDQLQPAHRVLPENVK